MLVFGSNEKYLIHKKVKQEICFNIYIFPNNAKNDHHLLFIILRIVRVANTKIRCLPKQEQLQVLRIMAVAGAALEDLSGRLATLAPLAEAWGMEDGEWLPAPRGSRLPTELGVS